MLEIWARNEEGVFPILGLLLLLLMGLVTPGAVRLLFFRFGLPWFPFLLLAAFPLIGLRNGLGEAIGCGVELVRAARLSSWRVSHSGYRGFRSYGQ